MPIKGFKALAVNVVGPYGRRKSYASLMGLKGHSGAELHIYFLVHLESTYYQIFFYSKIVPNCAVAK